MAQIVEQRQVIPLTAIVQDTFKQYKMACPKRLIPGTYHLLGFSVFRNPESRRLTAFLKCEEGNFWSATPLIVDELMANIGKVIRDTLKRGNIAIQIKIDKKTYEGCRKSLTFVLD